MRLISYHRLRHSIKEIEHKMLRYSHNTSLLYLYMLHFLNRIEVNVLRTYQMNCKQGNM